MKPFILTPRAEQDLGDIWQYIAGDSIGAADRVLTALEKALEKLAKNPGIGHLREELADRRHRFFLVLSDRLSSGNQALAGASRAPRRP